MRALCLREVNLPDGRSGEDQAHECVAQDGGDLADGPIERGIMIAHERSPSEDHPRRSPLRGRTGVWWRDLARLARCDTAFVNYIRGPVSERPAWGQTTPAMLLTNSWLSLETGRKRPPANGAAAHGIR